MVRKDLVSSLFFLVLAVCVCWESYAMGLGRLGRPGSGLFPFCFGIGLGTLAFAVLCKNLLTKGGVSVRGDRFGRPVLITFGSLLGYVWLLDTLGFIFTTFLFVGLLLKTVGKKNWARSALFALAVTLGLYVLLEIVLQARLPQGLLERFGF
ncbi:MAG: tripartite tricarboxylate transporter TctB family protein [Syntrophaceae bacterium]|nr:tripartite tricarboxylate transporter TctB family protein [Syntrophaceae bacterium]